MSRTRIELPSTFDFSTTIPVRITDINYGGHVGNDSILGLIHEARVLFLKYHGYTEMQFEGPGLIMRDVTIEFKAEIFYGDSLTAQVKAGNFSRAGFDVFYKLMIASKVVAVARTCMICFDYSTKKVVSLPPAAREKLER